MPVFFVHGVPDTHRLWDAIRSRLHRADIIAPSLPGFARPVPDDFDATKEAYAAWLIKQIEATGAPVDLVGHDWGSLLAQRIVSLRPDLVRTWVAGAAAVDSAYKWHDVARLWQTPGLGEQFMAGFTPDLLKLTLAGQGVPESYASLAVAQIDDVMKDCILKLYRSAVRVGEEWQPGLEQITRPALVIWGKRDPYVTLEVGERLARRVRGELLPLDGGHWWPVEFPAEAAAAMERFWAAH